MRLHALNGVHEGVTVNVAKISGGAPLNVVADNAVVRFNVRVPDAEAAAWIDRAIDEVCAVAPFEGVSIHRHGGFTRPAKPFDPAQAVTGIDSACLLLHGGADAQIVPMAEIQPLIDALGRRDKAGEVLVTPLVSHNLKPVTGPGDPGFAGPLAPPIADKLVGWLRYVLGA